jgi:hypothetical protein
LQYLQRSGYETTVRYSDVFFHPKVDNCLGGHTKYFQGELLQTQKDREIRDKKGESREEKYGNSKTVL